MFPRRRDGIVTHIRSPFVDCRIGSRDAAPAQIAAYPAIRWRRGSGRPHRRTGSLPAPRADQPPYCSSLTCSSQSTVLPSSLSWMAKCVMAVGALHRASVFLRGRTTPRRPAGSLPPARPALRAAASRRHNQRLPQRMRMPRRPRARLEGHACALHPRRLRRASNGSMRTVPVNQAAGPFPEGCVPARLISMKVSPECFRCCRLPPGRLLQLFRVARALHGNLRGSLVDLTEAVRRQLHVNRSDIFFKARQLCCTRDGHYPWLLFQKPRQCDLRRVAFFFFPIAFSKSTTA